MTLACQRNETELAYLLISRKGEVTSAAASSLYRSSTRGLCVIHYAAANDDAETIARLVEKHDADVHLLSHSGETPLVLAAQRGKAAACDALLKLGADVNARTQSRTSKVRFGECSASCAPVARLAGARGKHPSFSTSGSESSIHFLSVHDCRFDS